MHLGERSGERGSMRHLLQWHLLLLLIPVLVSAWNVRGRFDSAQNLKNRVLSFSLP